MNECIISQSDHLLYQIFSISRLKRALGSETAGDPGQLTASTVPGLIYALLQILQRQFG